MGTNTAAELVWNSNTKKFAIVSSSLACSMMSVGSKEGFNRGASRFRLDKITLSQAGKVARITIQVGKDFLWHECGRIEAKKLVSLLRKMTGAACFNVKDNGKLVAWNA
jgi:hypothetical protein